MNDNNSEPQSSRTMKLRLGTSIDDYERKHVKQLTEEFYTNCLINRLSQMLIDNAYCLPSCQSCDVRC